MHHLLSQRVQREKELLHLLLSPRYPLQSSKFYIPDMVSFELIPKLMNLPCYCDNLTLYDDIHLPYSCSLGSFTHSRHYLVLLFPLLTFFCCKRFETLRDCHVYPNLRISLFHTVRYDFHQIQCNFPFPSDFVDCIHIAYIMSYVSCWLCLVFVAVLLGLTNSPQVLTGCNPTNRRPTSCQQLCFALYFSSLTNIWYSTCRPTKISASVGLKGHSARPAILIVCYSWYVFVFGWFIFCLIWLHVLVGSCLISIHEQTTLINSWLRGLSKQHVK